MTADASSNGSPAFRWVQCPRLAALLVSLLSLSYPAAAESDPKFDIQLGTLWFVSVQDLDRRSDDDRALLIKRGHFDLHVHSATGVRFRFTPDLTRDAAGKVEVPIKFAYAEIPLRDFGPARNTRVEIGRVRTPWIWFEEEIYRYRLQDGAFMDRLGFFSSADDGAAVEGNLGPLLPERYRHEVQSGSAGRFGSFALALVRGNGIKDGERNDAWVFEGRATTRPWPTRVPGLQLSALRIDGEGNSSRRPAWRVAALLASYEGRRFKATLQGTQNRGTQSGRAIDARGSALRGHGWSAFAEMKPDARWSFFLRHDCYDPDRDDSSRRFTRSIAGFALHAMEGSMLLFDVERVRHADRLDSHLTRFQITAQIRIAPKSLAP